MEFYFEASKENVNYFRVRVEVNIRNNNATDEYSIGFIVDIEKDY